MGRALARAISESTDCALAAAIESDDHPDLGTEIAVLAGGSNESVRLTADAAAALAHADVLIDFTAPAVSVRLAELAARAHVAAVIGTTGFSTGQATQIEAASRQIAIVKSGNMSLGVALLAALVKQAAMTLPDFDIEILEMHHRLKKDAPSGTALLLGEAAARGRNVSLHEKAVRSRAGNAGQREEGSIGFASLRGGTAVGEHQVIFAGPQERIALSHIAEDRSIFARGALAAARWLRGRAPGLYGMEDVLGLPFG